MRLCRYQHNGTVEVALYADDRIVPLRQLADDQNIRLGEPSASVLDYLPPNGKSAKLAQQLLRTYEKLPAADKRRLSRPAKEARLRVPVPEPKKVILLAGNYAAHIAEGGGRALEREATFPYFFW